MTTDPSVLAAALGGLGRDAVLARHPKRVGDAQAVYDAVNGGALIVLRDYQDENDRLTQELADCQNPPPPPPPPPPAGDLAVPTGYKAWYVHDWAQNGDDGKWPFYPGKAGNCSCTYDPNQVKYVSGKGLVLTAQDDGHTLRSGRVLAGGLHVPTYARIRMIIEASGFGPGAWPSGWARGDDGVGEIDLCELFGGHIGTSMHVAKGTLIATGTPYLKSQAVLDYDNVIPKSAWNSEHMYEIIWTPASMQFIVDQKTIGFLSAANFSPKDPAYGWAQFAKAARTWHLRYDMQAGQVPGNSSAGPWPMGKGQVSSQTMRGIGIYVT